jgi:hypothetical protein
MTFNLHGEESLLITESSWANGDFLLEPMLTDTGRPPALLEVNTRMQGGMLRIEVDLASWEGLIDIAGGPVL